MSLLLLRSIAAFPTAPGNWSVGYFLDGTACHGSTVDLFQAGRIHTADARFRTAWTRIHHPTGGAQ